MDSHKRAPIPHRRVLSRSAQGALWQLWLSTISHDSKSISAPYAEFYLQPQEFPDTWDPPSKNTLSKLITTPVRSLQRRFSQASTLTPTERQDGQAEGLDAPSPTSPTSNTPVQPPKRALTLGRRLTRRKKPARLRAQSMREYIMNGRDEKRDPPAFLRKEKEDGN